MQPIWKTVALCSYIKYKREIVYKLSGLCVDKLQAMNLMLIREMSTLKPVYL